MYQQISQKQVKAARGIAKECSICQKKFELFLREHICKRCLRAVCSDCSPKKLIIVDYDLKPKEKHRVCTHCKSESKFQKKLRKENSLEFGKTSAISLRWLQSLNIITTAESQSEIHDLDESYNKARSKELIQNIDISRMKKHLSYSFRQFAHQVQGKDTPDAEVSKYLVNLLNKLAYRFDWKTLPNKFHLITFFFLTIASESIAFHLLVEIYTNYIPNYAIEFMNDPPSSADRSLSQNQKVKIQKILNYLISQYKYQDFEQKQVQSFIQFFGLELVSSLYVDMLSVECFFTSIDDMITKNTFMEIERIFIMITRFHHDYIKKCSPSSKDEYQAILLHLIRNTSLQAIKEKCKGEKTFENNSRNDSFESKIFKGTQSLTNMENQKAMIQNDPEIMKSQSMMETQNNQTSQPVTPNQQQKEEIVNEQINFEFNQFNAQHEEHKVNSEFPPPPMMLPENVEQAPIMNISNQVNGNVTESESNSEESDKEEEEQYNVKHSIQYAAEAFINQPEQDHHYQEEENEQKQKEEDIYKSEISFYQRSLQQKEKDIYEKNELIKKLHSDLKNIPKENTDDLKAQLIEKDIQIQQLSQKLTISEEKYSQLEHSLNESAQHPHNNACIDKLWKELQQLQKKQEEIREEKVVLEQDLLTQKEDILIKHLREIALLKGEIEEYQKQQIESQEKHSAETAKHFTQVSALETTISQKVFEITTLQNENTSLQAEIVTLKESEALLKSQSEQKTQQSIAYSTSVDAQIKELQSNLESMRASNSSLIQEHKTLMDLTIQNNNLIFEELKIQIEEHVETIKKQTTQIEQGQLREAALTTQVNERDSQIIEQETEIKRLRQDLTQHEVTIADKEQKIQALELRVREDQSQIGQLEFQVKLKEEQVEDLRSKQMAQTAQYKTDMELTTSNLKDEQQKRKEAEKVIEATQTELSSTLTQLEQSQQHANQLENQINTLNEQTAKQQHQIEQLTQESEDKSVAITGYQFEIAASKANTERLEEEIAQLKLKLENRCEEHDQTIKKLKSDLNKANNELNKYLGIFQSVRQTVTNVKESSENDD